MIVRKTIGLDKDWLEWYEETYPGCGTWGLIQKLCQAFRDAHVVTPDVVAEIAAQQVASDMMRGKQNNG